MKDMAKPKVLFLVHIEEMFRRYFPDQLYPLRLRRACRAKKYDRVFLLLSGVENRNPIREVQDVVGQWQYIDWGWGYEEDMFDEEENAFVIPSNGHEWTWIPPELRAMQSQLAGYDIFVGGGAESECLQDFCDILGHWKLDFKKVRGYIF